jgi:hypothetical protein
MRFNPPPNWPPPPPGWVPDSNWTPDPSWPPAPPGWQFWVDDSAPHYPYQVPPGYPPHWPPPAPSRSASRKALWIALVAVAVVIVVVGAVFAFGHAGGPTSAAGGETSKKPDITQLTRDLLVDKSAFPESGRGKRSSGLGGNDGKASGMSNLSVDPQECADFYGYSKSATQTAFATVSTLDSSGPHSLEVHLAITPDRKNLKEDLKKCQSFTVSLELARRTVTFDAKLEPLEAPGAPPWAVAAVMNSSSSPFPGLPISMSVTSGTISGYYRGVLVVAAYNKFNRRSKDNASIDSDDVNDLVKLFDAQIETLENAP